MFAAFAGGVSMSLGFLGLILGAVFAGLVYVVFALIVKASGVQWINRLMPAVIIGPIVAIIGLSLAGNAVGDMVKGDGAATSPYVALICALVTLFVVILCSVYGSKKVRLIPFILGILAGYAVALVFTLIGNATDNEALKVINFAPFTALFAEGVSLKTFLSVPQFSFLIAKDGLKELNGTYVLSIFFAYVPVAAVVFAEHLADHKNPLNTMPSTGSALSMMARDSTWYPASRSFCPPGWKPFSTATPMPTSSAPDCFTISVTPRNASPMAKKSSMTRTLSVSWSHWRDTSRVTFFL